MTLPNSILDLSAHLRAKNISPVELTLDSLNRIEQLNPALNAWITITRDEAMEQARHAESEIQQGKWRGPLHGVPLGLKDLVDTAGIKTTAASAIFKDRVPEQDAQVTQQLKQAGAVLLGKQNLHEFAYGGSSIISYFGEVHNPWDLTHIAGGSSGGSAASVAAELGYGAIGTDTAGSIREPAAQCGVVGLKPTYGRVSARGVVPLSISLDHVGPITRTVADAALMLQVIADPQARDGAGKLAAVPDYLGALDGNVGGTRLGIPRAYFYEDLDAEVAELIEQALQVLRSLGGNLHDTALPINSSRVLQSYEAYLYHAEFLGDNSRLYQPETLRRILSGRNTEWAGYTQSLLELKEMRRKIAGIFHDIDLLVTPSVPIPAPTIASLKEDPDLLRPRELVLLRNTHPFNVWGLPAISVPCGFTKAGLPVGLQIAGPHWGEAAVLRAAHAYEQATEWHKRRPKILSD